mgnify:CR=1 FL=1
MIFDGWADLLIGYSSKVEANRLALVQFSGIILSLALKNYFALRANGFRGRSLLLAFLFDVNALTVIFILGLAVDRTILVTYSGNMVPLLKYYANVVTVLMPLLLSVIVATPYVGPLFSWILWPLVFLNTLSLGHGVIPRLSFDQLLLGTMPGFLIIFFGVLLVQRNQWLKAYMFVARSSKSFNVS